MIRLSILVFYVASCGLLFKQVVAQNYGFEDLPPCAQLCVASASKGAGCFMSSTVENQKCVCPHSPAIADCAFKNCDFLSGKSVPQILSFICSSVGNQNPSATPPVSSTSSSLSTSASPPASSSSSDTTTLSHASDGATSQTPAVSPTNTSSATTTATPTTQLNTKVSQSSTVIVVQTAVEAPNSTDVPGSTNSATGNLSGSHLSIGISVFLAMLAL